MSKKKIVLDILKYALFFGAGLGIFIWVYSGQNPDKIWAGLKDFNYWWIAASLGISMFSHLFRAMRWKMLIESIGYKPRLSNTFLSILVMYLANYALPRLGEVTRCGILKKYEQIPFTEQLGTVLMERVVDVIVLIVMLIVVFLADWDTLVGFLMPGSGNIEYKDISFLGSWWFLGLIGLFLLICVAVWLFRKRLARIRGIKKLTSFAGKFVEGLKSVLHLKNPWLFILLTLGIYGSYYLMTWFVMLGFRPTQGLSPFIALAVLAMGSVGMVLPVQAGMGTYHFFVTQTLMLYAIVESEGAVLALVLHGSTTIFVIIIGVIALVLLPLINRERIPAGEQ
ncbi:MAG: lysylphosphatidylglycerol synthase transmembrane domain-containing protein [Bacteroidota bacterium]